MDALKLNLPAYLEVLLQGVEREMRKPSGANPVAMALAPRVLDICQYLDKLRLRQLPRSGNESVNEAIELLEVIDRAEARLHELYQRSGELLTEGIERTLADQPLSESAIRRASALLGRFSQGEGPPCASI